MFPRWLQYFLLALLITTACVQAAELRVGATHQMTFTDVDQRRLATSDGHITVITVVTRKDEDKAQAVGDSIPHQYYGDPKFRLVTLVNFQQGIFPAIRGMVMAMIRHRLNGEAKELQKVYTQKHLTRNPREDIFVVADFDGKAVSQLNIAPTSPEFGVFVFDGRGRLIRHWSEVPPATTLAAALVEAQ